MMSESRTVYFISEHAEQQLIHGGVGPYDIERILETDGAIPIRFPDHFNFSVLAKIRRIQFLRKTLRDIKANAVVIFQHPLYAGMDRLLTKFLERRKDVKLICLVDDIDGLKDWDSRLLEAEIRFFKRHRYFILHNKNMEAWLRKFHPDFRASYLNLFDFLVEYKVYPRRKSNTIVFAGNLQKSSFLEHLSGWLNASVSLQLHLYGPYITERMLDSKAVFYKGLHPPHALPDLVEGSFGLVWDGEGVEKPAGSLGDYMHYISHHKLSLYIICNLPVIVHEDAGSAELVKQYRIGFTVSSLSEVQQKIETLTEQEYDEMVKNTRPLARQITSGNCVRNALEELLRVMK
jgi:hypothetical protein